PAPMVTVKDLKKAEQLRRGGVYTMATGGVIATVGLGVMVGYTIAGRRLSKDLIAAEEMVNLEDCAYKNTEKCDTLDAKVAGLSDRRESANMATQVAGATFAAG